MLDLYFAQSEAYVSREDFGSIYPEGVFSEEAPECLLQDWAAAEPDEARMLCLILSPEAEAAGLRKRAEALAERAYPEWCERISAVRPEKRKDFFFGVSGKKLLLLLPVGDEKAKQSLKGLRPFVLYLAKQLTGETAEALGEGAFVYAVNISEKKGTVKKEVCSIRLRKDWGIEGDAHAGNWHRQISLLAEESIDAMRNKISFRLPNGIFAENINTNGISLKELRVGTLLQVGPCLLQVTQIGKQCHDDGCAIKRATGNCVMPTEGIFATVEKEGTVRAGDPICLLD